MPWKIKKSTNLTDPKNPVIHMFDGTVNVNMVTHLDSGVVDLWVGNNDPQLAGIYITIDSERQPIVQVEPTANPPQGLDLAVMTTVLETLGQDPEVLLKRFRRNPRPRSFNTGERPRARSFFNEAKPST